MNRVDRSTSVPIASRVFCLIHAGADQITKPEVLLGVNLAPCEPLVENPPRVRAVILVAGTPPHAADQDITAPDQQAPEDDEHSPAKSHLPHRPLPAVPEHHRHHLP